MEEAHGLGQGVFDQHTLGVAGQQLGVGGVTVIGQQNGQLVVAEVEDEELTQGGPGQADRLLEHARGLELARCASSTCKGRAPSCPR